MKADRAGLVEHGHGRSMLEGELKIKPCPADPSRRTTRISTGRRTSRRTDLKRDEIRTDRHRALAYGLGMIFSENRCTLFRIML